MTVAPTSPAQAKSALDRAIEADLPNLVAFLSWCAGRKGLRGADGEDVVAETFRTALSRERRLHAGGDGGGASRWDPTVERLEYHLRRVLDGVVANRGRSRRRSRIVNEHELPDAASEAPSAEAALIARQQEDEDARIVAEELTAQTHEGLTVPLLEAMRRGVEGHDKLADELKCTVPKVRAAIKRIRRRIDAVAERRRKAAEENAA